MRHPDLASPPQWRRMLLAASALVAVVVSAFFIGRALATHGIDFVVYHRAAQSLLSGRTDLYAPSFALDPPMRYVYPPLFVLLVAPLGRLEYDLAFGLWFALLLTATVVVIAQAVSAWRGRAGWSYGLAAGLLAGPALIYGLRSANVHLLVVLMTVAAVVAWGQGRPTRAAVLVALAGAIKVFPLGLLPVFAVLREWKLLVRTCAVSALLWALPLAYFGPARSIELYGEWWHDIGGNVERLRRESRLDVSLESTVTRWLSRVDFSSRTDGNYPQANLLELAPAHARAFGRGLTALLVFTTGLALLRLAASVADRRRRAAVAGSLWIAAQLLVGPYTTLLYLSAWLLPVLALPAAAEIQARALPTLRRALLAAGILHVAMALAPGSAAHRALEAWGAHTLLSGTCWLLAVWIAWRFPRDRRPSRA